jgi:hypothetical protein
MSQSHSRREALRALARVAGAAVVTLALPRGAGALVRRARHPDPRPGITAANVLAEGAVPERAREAYRVAREIPGILDGIYCHCDCAERDGKRSLLGCFEGTMASTCGICRGEATLAGKLNAKGKSLDEIRAAVDDEYGR